MELAVKRKNQKPKMVHFTHINYSTILVMTLLFQQTVALKCFTCVEAALPDCGETSVSSSYLWNCPKIIENPICIMFRSHRTGLIRLGCFAKEIEDLCKLPAADCQTCNTDGCNTGEGVIITSGLNLGAGVNTAAGFNQGHCLLSVFSVVFWSLSF